MEEKNKNEQSIKYYKLKGIHSTKTGCAIVLSISMPIGLAMIYFLLSSTSSSLGIYPFIGALTLIIVPICCWIISKESEKKEKIILEGATYEDFIDNVYKTNFDIMKKTFDKKHIGQIGTIILLIICGVVCLFSLSECCECFFMATLPYSPSPAVGNNNACGNCIGIMGLMMFGPILIISTSLIIHLIRYEFIIWPRLNEKYEYYMKIHRENNTAPLEY